MIKLENVTKCYGSKRVLDDVSLKVKSGEIVAVIGPSGSGKSTLLRTINLLEIPDVGAVAVDGVQYDASSSSKQTSAIKAIRGATGMVFQSFNLFPHMTALENVAYAPRVVKNMTRDGAQDLAKELLGRVGLSEYSTALPRSLSGGQQQRVAIARALAMAPKVMLFDEPTSALDPEMVGEVLNLLRSIAATGMTMIVVSHEMRFVESVATQAVFIEDGRIRENAPAKEMLNKPKTLRAQVFLSKLTS